MSVPGLNELRSSSNNTEAGGHCCESSSQKIGIHYCTQCRCSRMHGGIRGLWRFTAICMCSRRI